ncbi:MAG: DNA cytosine methyltransferase [Microbacteriaceae bacterium]
MKHDSSVTSIKVASFFSGAGGLDLGFHKAGFELVWANEFDKKVTPTLRHNFPNSVVDDRSITLVDPSDVPDVDGIIGGPPCQSWSEAGANRGLDDARGQVFLDYIRLIKAKKPKFFLAENVSGMLSKTHAGAFQFLISEMEKLGYDFEFKLLNAADFGVPEDRLRVIFVGYHKDLGRKQFEFPQPQENKLTLKDAIWDLRNSAVPAAPGNKSNGKSLKVMNHEYMTGGFSTIFLSRNRVRGWNEQSFTIQAGARHAPLHPQAPKMVKVGPNEQIFQPGSEHLYRRLTVREAARIQTFPDDFEFIYENIADGYKMVGNAVAVNFAQAIAEVIYRDISAG